MICTGDIFIVLNYLKQCTYQKMIINMKSQRYEWPAKYYLKTTRRWQAPLIPDLPEKC